MTRVARCLALLLLVGCGGDEAPGEHEGHAHDEPGHEEGEHEEGVVELTPEATAAARLDVQPVAEGTLGETLTRPGRIALDPRKEAAVSAWIPGQVDGISVRTGDRVRKGQVLATVQSPEIGEAIGAFRAALARDEAAEARLQRLRQLEAEGVSSRAQVLEAEAVHAEADGALEAAEERLRVMGVDPSQGDPHAGEHYTSHVPVRTPIDGEVLAADAQVGQLVQPGTRLFHVGDLDTVWLLVDAYEQDLPRVEVGQTVQFTTESWPGEVFEATIDHVGSLVDPQSRTVEVRAVVDNPGHRLKPNQFASAVLSGDSSRGPVGFVVPEEAVVELDGATVVFVRTAPGRFEARPVVVTTREVGKALISSGVEPGDTVVFEGAFALKSELEKGELGEGHAH